MTNNACLIVFVDHKTIIAYPFHTYARMLRIAADALSAAIRSQF